MDVQVAAEKTIDAVDQSYGDKPCPLVASRHPGGMGANHAMWMLEGIRLGYVQYEQAHRWLGYAQAVLLHSDHLGLDIIKQINKES